MADTLRMVVAGADPSLRDEITDAMSLMADSGITPQYVRGHLALLDTVRSSQPDLVVLDHTGDIKELRQSIEDVQQITTSPTTIAILYRPELFHPDISESAFFIEATRAGASDFLRRPVSPADLQQLIKRVRQPVGKRARHNGRVVSFISNKGGVGKSTLAVSTACLLARTYSERVLLIDGSIQMGVCSAMLDLQPTTTLTDCVHERNRLDEGLLKRLAVPHASGLHLLAAPRDAEEAALIDEQLFNRIITLARRAYDYVVIDTFPMLDRTTLNIMDLSDRTYLVMENVVPTVLGMGKLVELLDRMGYTATKQRMILNRFDSGLRGPHVADVADRLARTIDYVIPYSRRVIMAANTGQPYALQASRWWGFGKAIRAVVRDIEQVPKATRQDEARQTPREEVML